MVHQKRWDRATQIAPDSTSSTHSSPELQGLEHLCHKEDFWWPACHMMKNKAQRSTSYSIYPTYGINDPLTTWSCNHWHALRQFWHHGSNCSTKQLSMIVNTMEPVSINRVPAPPPPFQTMRCRHGAIRHGRGPEGPKEPWSFPTELWLCTSVEPSFPSVGEKSAQTSL